MDTPETGVTLHTICKGGSPGLAGRAPGRPLLLGAGGAEYGWHRYAYIPFGGGRRACVGASFADLETVLLLCTLAVLAEMNSSAAISRLLHPSTAPSGRLRPIRTEP
jgi:hypothetical protein